MYTYLKLALFFGLPGVHGSLFARIGLTGELGEYDKYPSLNIFLWQVEFLLVSFL